MSSLQSTSTYGTIYPPIDDQYVMTSGDDRERLLNDVKSGSGVNDRTSIDGGDVISVHSADVISVHSLQYVIGKKKNGRVILDDISTIFKPGLNAILGRTGSGKTTMLDILAGRRNMSSVSGQVLVNGSPQQEHYSESIGYVLQSDDVVMGTLTVRENITFSANLRLSSSLSRTEKDNRVQDIIDELGLRACAESLIGTILLRGVSGGERKRTNIGMELVISPSVLFLDEPTTGLDASTANAVMSTLKRLSVRGNTIVFAVHQPRRSMYAMFDRLTLLAQGRVVYHGPADEALDFFRTTGRHCEEWENPLDYFIDHITDDNGVRQRGKTVRDRQGRRQADPGTKLSNANDILSEENDILTAYNSSIWKRKVLAELKSIEAKGATEFGTAKKKTRQYPTSFCTQVKYLAKRCATNIIRDPLVLSLQIIYKLLTGLMFGLIFFQMDQRFPAGLQNRYGLLYFLTTESNVSCITFLMAVIQEIVIIRHEKASGYYRASAYILVAIFVDVTGYQIVGSSTLYVVVYVMSGLRKSLASALSAFLALILSILSASGLCLIVGITLKVPKLAHNVVFFILLNMMILAGLIVNVTSLPSWLSWIKYMSFMRYTLSALAITELQDMPFYVYNGTTIVESLPSAGNDFLVSQGIHGYGSSAGYLQNISAVFSAAVILNIIGYVQLRRLRTRL